MAHPEGESENGPLRLVFGHRPKLEFHGARFTSGAGLSAVAPWPRLPASAEDDRA